MTSDRFDSPKAAALAGWNQTPKAAARVVEVTIRGSRAEVVLDLEPAHREWVYCYLGPDGWSCPGSGGPIPNWDDPDVSPWEP